MVNLDTTIKLAGSQDDTPRPKATYVWEYVNFLSDGESSPTKGDREQKFAHAIETSEILQGQL